MKSRYSAQGGGAAPSEYGEDTLPAYQPLVTDGFLQERTGVRGRYAGK